MKTTIICIVMFFCVFIFGHTAFAATLSVESGGFLDGDIMKIDVYATTDQKNPFNAASALLSLPKSAFTIIDIDISDSIFNLWSEEPYFNQEKQSIGFSGGTSALGGHIFKGKVLSILAKPTKYSSGDIAIEEGSILAHNGEGTDILTFTQDYSFRIEQAVPQIFDTDNSGVVSIKELSIGLMQE